MKLVMIELFMMISRVSLHFPIILLDVNTPYVKRELKRVFSV